LVGVGQSEVDVAVPADTTVVVQAPGLGDDMQADKAGILEIADVLVVNKSDRGHSIRSICTRSIRPGQTLGASRCCPRKRRPALASTLSLRRSSGTEQRSQGLGRPVAGESSATPRRVAGTVPPHGGNRVESGLRFTPRDCFGERGGRRHHVAGRGGVGIHGRSACRYLGDGRLMSVVAGNDKNLDSFGISLISYLSEASRAQRRARTWIRCAAGVPGVGLVRPVLARCARFRLACHEMIKSVSAILHQILSLWYRLGALKAVASGWGAPRGTSVGVISPVQS
jgi:hypothetical protein